MDESGPAMSTFGKLPDSQRGYDDAQGRALQRGSLSARNASTVNDKLRMEEVTHYSRSDDAQSAKSQEVV